MSVNRLRELRQQRNLSLAELSKLTGVSDSSISLIENLKRTPSVRNAMKLAKALNVQVYEIFPYNGENNTL